MSGCVGEEERKSKQKCRLTERLSRKTVEVEMVMRKVLKTLDSHRSRISVSILRNQRTSDMLKS